MVMMMMMMMMMCVCLCVCVCVCLCVCVCVCALVDKECCLCKMNNWSYTLVQRYPGQACVSWWRRANASFVKHRSQVWDLRRKALHSLSATAEKRGVYWYRNVRINILGNNTQLCSLRCVAWFLQNLRSCVTIYKALILISLIVRLDNCLQTLFKYMFHYGCHNDNSTGV
jgi:hypothetical protein